MRAYRSPSQLPHHNLAWEEWWLDRVETLGPALLFYVNAPALVVGKNQNPWRECSTGVARRERVALARRVSGGGTVYHDTGNLNYSAVLPRAGYRQDEVFDRALAALHDLGIHAQLAAGNSLTVQGLKFSGNAFCFRGPGVLHHGTLLVQSDLVRLRRYLSPALPNIETRAIASRPAAVVNLTDVRPGLSMDRLQESLAAAFCGSPDVEDWKPPRDATWLALVDKHAGPGWVFGHTPPFACTIESTEGLLILQVEKGHVVSAVARWCEGRAEDVPALAGCAFGSAECARRLGSQHATWARELESAGF